MKVISRRALYGTVFGLRLFHCAFCDAELTPEYGANVKDYSHLISAGGGLVPRLIGVGLCKSCFVESGAVSSSFHTVQKIWVDERGEIKGELTEVRDELGRRDK